MNAGSTTKRHVPCKTPAIASKCYWTHGRLGFYNGTPTFRLWKIGTRRLLGIFSGPSAFGSDSLDNENPEFPANVERVFDPTSGHRLFGDFEVCPLEPQKPGAMQAACIESARHLVVEK